MPKVYAFDVDETLEISNGPVTLQSVLDLRNQGHITGICGNWGLFVQRVLDWQHLVSFINAAPPIFIPELGRVDKAWFLGELKKYIPADEYILVGNVLGELNSLGFKCGSEDSDAALKAKWRFIKEDDFARGER